MILYIEAQIIMQHEFLLKKIMKLELVLAMVLLALRSSKDVPKPLLDKIEKILSESDVCKSSIQGG